MRTDRIHFLGVANLIVNTAQVQSNKTIYKFLESCENIMRGNV